ncbi:CidA/LrgA family protein [Methylobacterium haplocladii]|uniref:CidA/LrgA family protein n=1 Tax=Methylobacterium haplocladii TaxID=1176176 RepID=A0A512IPW3_9HYPH|nr:CidA/LrgA family protein [Methylobacterium haplocladii]GEO99753.1 CidA/LrgA family protein [Methylobacterium haplocladii]GJD84614.1 Holin-like protein CidA [Methylobacterium haplocladii]GLS60146.1 CidA/LrgA family protein [Methylobacterium haplocladii]
MIVSLALILLAQLLGEVVAHGSGLPVPGPVLGAVLMFGFLLVRDRYHRSAERMLPKPLVQGELEGTAKGLLAHLSLMFVPAGVGIVGRLDVLAANGLALAVVLLVSVVLTLSATALTFVAVSRLVRPRRPDETA